MTAIDHDERRRRIAKATLDVIAREGLEAATIRRIAAEFGGPTKLVTHYFVDKQELLLWAYRVLAEHAQQSLNEVVARDPTDIVGGLCALSAIDEKGFRVYLALCDRATRDPVIAELQRVQMDLTIARIAGIVRARNGDRADLESVSQRLNGVMQGISIQALMDKERWSAERIGRALAEEVDVVLGRPTSATGLSSR